MTALYWRAMGTRAAISLSLLLFLGAAGGAGFGPVAAQNADQGAVNALLRGEREVAARFKVAKPTYYLTDRAGISHVSGPLVFLRAARVVKGPSIAVHETVHLLLGTDPAAPRNLPETPPDIEATTGVWLAEGFASHVATELAPRLGLPPDRLFLKGDGTTVDAEAAEWCASRGDRPSCRTWVLAAFPKGCRPTG